MPLDAWQEDSIMTGLYKFVDNYNSDPWFMLLDAWQEDSIMTSCYVMSLTSIQIPGSCSWMHLEILLKNRAMIISATQQRKDVHRKLGSCSWMHLGILLKIEPR